MRPWQRVHLQDQRERSRRQQTQSSCPCSCAQSCWRQWHCSHAEWIHAFNSMAIFHFFLKLHSLGTTKDFIRNPNNSKKTEFAFGQGWRSKTCCSGFACETDDYLFLNLWWYIGGYIYYDWHHTAKNVFGVTKFTISQFRFTEQLQT